KGIFTVYRYVIQHLVGITEPQRIGRVYAVHRIHHTRQVGIAALPAAGTAWGAVTEQAGVGIVKRSDHRKFLAIIKIVDAYAPDMPVACSAPTGYLAEKDTFFILL